MNYTGSVKFKKEKLSEMWRPPTAVQLVWFIEPYKDASLVKKTYHGSTKADVRMSNVGSLSIESGRTTALNLDLFVNMIAKNHKKHRMQLM